METRFFSALIVVSGLLMSPQSLLGTGIPVVDASHIAATDKQGAFDIIHHTQTMGEWAQSLNNQIEQINTAVDHLTYFGDPSKIAQLIGLDSLLGSDSALGGLLGATMDLGDSVFSSIDGAMGLLGRGMQMYEFGQRVADGDVLALANAVGMGSVGSLLSMEGAFESYGSGIQGFQQMSSMQRAAWGNVADAMRQVRSASTAVEVDKAKANLEAQLQYANGLSQRAAADQSAVSNVMAADEMSDRYRANLSNISLIDQIRMSFGLQPTGQQTEQQMRGVPASGAPGAQVPYGSLPSGAMNWDPDDPNAMMNMILASEGRFDANGNLQVYSLPGNDGGGSYEIAGINERYHPQQAAHLRGLIDSGQYDAARSYAGNYIMNYTSGAANLATNPGTEYFLRDTNFNRGAGGMNWIAQHAAGITPSMSMSQSSANAIRTYQQQNPEQYLSNLRQSREVYENTRVGYRPNLHNGLVNRWNTAYSNAVALNG